MRREGKKPSDFGLYVRAHPDTLIVTAKNKMRYTDNKAFSVSYDGKLEETYIIPASVKKNDNNRNLLVSLFKELAISAQVYEESNSYLYRDIPWERIQDFIGAFNFHRDMFDLQEGVPQYIKEISDIYPHWDVIFRSLAGTPAESGYPIAAQQRSAGYDSSKSLRIPPSSEPGWYTGNKQRFSGNSMFIIGLNADEKVDAKNNAELAERKTPIFSDYTNARRKPVLMLHLLNLVDSDKQELIHLAPAISVSFPNSNEFRTVEYVVGPVWLKQFDETRYDSSDEEDDYDQ